MTMSKRHLKKLGLSLLVVTLVSGGLLSAGAIAGKQVSEAAAASVAAPVTKAPPLPLLWKVSNQDNAVYLLGSFHLLKVDDYPLSADIDQAFADADRIVFEVPPSELTDPATAQKMQAAAGYGDGRTLTTVLPAALREKLGRLLGTGSIAQLDAYEPWFVSLSLMLGMSQAMGFQSNQGLDQHLMARAAAEGKPVAGLETIDAQLELLDSSPLAEQISSLQEFLDNPTEMPGKLTELHGAWRDGDVAKLNRIAIGEMREKTPETYRLINVQRNDAWVPQVRTMLDAAETGDTLVVVGTLHLLGDDGIVEKLRGQGYTVERICSACAGEAAASQ